MSVGQILRPNNYVLYAGDSLRSPEIKISNNDKSTTLSSSAVVDYTLTLPASGATENSLMTVNENGEISFLGSSNLPTIGGDIVCNSVSAGSFISVNGPLTSNTLEVDNFVKCNALRLENNLGGLTVINSQQTDNSTGDSITLPSTVAPNEPSEGMSLKVSSAVDGGQGFSVNTVWGYPTERVFLNAYTGDTITYSGSNRGVAFDLVNAQVLEQNSTYRVDIDLQWFKQSAGSNNPNFWVYISNNDLQPFRYAGRSFSNYRDSLSRSNGETVDQVFSLSFLTGNELADRTLRVRFFNNTGAWTDWFGRYKIKLYREYNTFSNYASNGNPIPS